MHVLLLRWVDDDLGVVKEIKDLHHVFTEIYHYDVQLYEIPNAKPDKTLKRRLYDFLQQEEDSMNTMLFIVYYGEHARKGLQTNEAPIWLALGGPFLISSNLFN